MSHRKDLPALVQQVRNQGHARLLLRVVQRQQFLSFEPLIAAWLRAVWDMVRDVLQLDLVGENDLEFDFDPSGSFAERHYKGLRAFLQQVARLGTREVCGGVSIALRNHLLDTRIVDASQEEEIARYGQLFGRYWREWLKLAAEDRGRGLLGELLSHEAVAA